MGVGKKMIIQGYIHKDYLKEIKIKGEAEANFMPEKKEAIAKFSHPKRGIMVWDKKWSDGNDIAVIIEIPKNAK